jgi:hypothetical protein
MVRIPALALGALTLLPAAAMAGSGTLDIPDLGGFASRASEHTEITIGPVLMGLVRHMAGRDMSAEDRRVLEGVKRVVVHTFEFDEQHSIRPEDFASVRAQLRSANWTPLVRSHSTADDEDVDIAVAMEHDESTGLAILVTSPRELTVVNVVGHISPQDLARISGSIGVPANAAAAIQGKTVQPAWAH